MNPTQKQFSLNRGASRKQIPISNSEINGNEKFPIIYECKVCKYIAWHKSDFTKHNATKRHINMSLNDNPFNDNIKMNRGASRKQIPISFVYIPAVVIVAAVIVAAALFTFISGKKNGNKTGYGVQPSRDSSSTGVRYPHETLDIFLKGRFPRAQNLNVVQNGQVGDSHFYIVEVYPGSGRAAWDSYEAVVKGGSVTGFTRQ